MAPIISNGEELEAAEAKIEEFENQASYDPRDILELERAIAAYDPGALQKITDRRVNQQQERQARKDERNAQQSDRQEGRDLRQGDREEGRDTRQEARQEGRGRDDRQESRDRDDELSRREERDAENVSRREVRTGDREDTTKRTS